MKSEPKVRADGACHTCKGARPEGAVKEGDPFCSTECCREYQGIARKTSSVDGRRMPDKATVAKQQASRKRSPGSNFEIRGKRSARVRP